MGEFYLEVTTRSSLKEGDAPLNSIAVVHTVPKRRKEDAPAVYLPISDEQARRPIDALRKDYEAGNLKQEKRIVVCRVLKNVPACAEPEICAKRGCVHLAAKTKEIEGKRRARGRQ